MALALKLKYAITTDKTKLVVADDTGIYNVNNPGGWGAPNINRNETGLLCYVSYQPYDKPLINLSATNAISPIFLYDTNYINAEVSEFEFNYIADGWYRIALIAITEEEYANLTPADFESLINSEEYLNVFLEDIPMVNLITQKNCQSEKFFECLQCTTCKCDQIKEELVKIDALIQATDYRFHSAKQFEAQRMVETLTKQYKCCK
jgi:hypothetical protein